MKHYEYEKKYHSIVKKLWAHNKYATRYKNTYWRWEFFPFSNNLSSIDHFDVKVQKKINNISILEVGSAMGAAYNFLKNSSIVCVNKYTGIEISTEGNRYCKKKYKKGKWTHSDFTKYKFNRKYDYSFERHAVHHMTNPIKQYEKMLKNTRISSTLIFRGCLNGKTISDINKSCFYRREGKILCNIINVFEVIKLGFKFGFNDIRVLFGGMHEPFSRDSIISRKNPTNPKFNPFLHEDVDFRKKIIVSSFIVRLRRNKKLKKNRVYLKKSFKSLIKWPFVYIKLYLMLKNIN